MKISKLFHWLYALVMLLPIFAIGVTCGYAMFNKNAYQSYSGLNENTESIIDVDTINDFDYSKTYYINNSQLTTTTTTRSSAYMYFDSIEIVLNGTNKTDEEIESIDRMYFYLGNDTYTLYFNFYAGDTAISLNSGNNFIFKVKIRSIIGNTNQQNTLDYVFSNSGALYYIDYFVEQQIDNVFYYAVDKVTESPLFNWAYNSFLAVPFTYITNLFGIPSTSIIIELLSYWLAISIIWLVFDLIMYVPLLVHRWIDKGVLE